MGPALRTHCDGWTQWISLAFFLAEQWPRFLCGGHRAAMRLALQEILNGADREDDIAQCRGWKLFLLLPRLLLFRPTRGGLIPKQQLQNRFSWEQLLLQSEECEAVASKAFQRKRTTQADTPKRRTDRAQSLVMVGEVSAGSHALEGAPLARGTQRTLDQLRDPVRRPTSANAPLPEALLDHHAEGHSRWTRRSS